METNNSVIDQQPGLRPHLRHHRIPSTDRPCGIVGPPENYIYPLIDISPTHGSDISNKPTDDNFKEAGEGKPIPSSERGTLRSCLRQTPDSGAGPPMADKRVQWPGINDNSKHPLEANNRENTPSRASSISLPWKKTAPKPVEPLRDPLTGRPKISYPMPLQQRTHPSILNLATKDGGISK